MFRFSLAGRHLRELLARVFRGMHLPLPFHFAALALHHVAKSLSAFDFQMPTIEWRAAGAIHSFLAVLVMELAEGGCAYRLCCHLLLHTWGLPRLSVCITDEAGEGNLRLNKCFARVTSTLPDDINRECLTHELYMTLVHTGATHRQGHLQRTNGGPSSLSHVFLELLKHGGRAWCMC